ncbi:hypothetical protein BU17DRAFT_69391 [Hysterangium stoloniferum]|nr:hypothetical protein BU17DRAFT_69391 [Hysterangium stoloniferum]
MPLFETSIKPYTVSPPPLPKKNGGYWPLTCDYDSGPSPFSNYDSSGCECNLYPEDKVGTNGTVHISLVDRISINCNISLLLSLHMVKCSLGAVGEDLMVEDCDQNVLVLRINVTNTIGKGWQWDCCWASRDVTCWGWEGWQERPKSWTIWYTSSSSNWMAAFEIILGDRAAVLGFVHIVIIVMVVIVCLDGEEIGKDFKGKFGGLYEDGMAAALVANLRVVFIQVVIDTDGIVKKLLSLPYTFP